MSAPFIRPPRVRSVNGVAVLAPPPPQQVRHAMLDARERARPEQGAIGLFGRGIARRDTIAVMRILMLSVGETAPGERVHELAAELARAGHHVDLVAPEQPSPDAGVP